MTSAQSDDMRGANYGFGVAVSALLVLGGAACTAQAPNAGSSGPSGIEASAESKQELGVTSWEREKKADGSNSFLGYDDKHDLRVSVRMRIGQGAEGVEYNIVSNVAGEDVAKLKAEVFPTEIRVAETTFQNSPKALRALKLAIADVGEGGGAAGIGASLTAASLRPLDQAPELTECPENLDLTMSCFAGGVGVATFVATAPACLTVIGCIVPIASAIGTAWCAAECINAGIDKIQCQD